MRIIPRGEIPLKPATSVARITPEGWVFHWVGGKLPVNPTEAQSKATIRNLQAHAQSNGYNDIQYNFMVDLAGRIFEGRGWDRANGSNGTSSANSHAWSVCSMSGPGNAMTEAEKNAVLWLTQEGARRKAAVSYVKPHREVRGVSTACPGDERAAFSVVATRKLHEHEAPAPSPSPTPQPEEEDMQIINVRKAGVPDNQQPYAFLDPVARKVQSFWGFKIAWDGGGGDSPLVGTKDPKSFNVPGSAPLIGWDVLADDDPTRKRICVYGINGAEYNGTAHG